MLESRNVGNWRFAVIQCPHLGYGLATKLKLRSRSSPFWTLGMQTDADIECMLPKIYSFIRIQSIVAEERQKREESRDLVGLHCHSSYHSQGSVFGSNFEIVNQLV